MKKLLTDKYHSALNDLISSLKRSGFLNDERVESAFRSVPRHEFVPSSKLDVAYDNKPLQIMKNQTISQPAVVSIMTEWLDVRDGQKILEVGTGSGWQTAILGFLAGTGTVYSMERPPELVKFAQKNFERLGIDNVNVILGDGSMGNPSAALYDRIMITAACSEIPLPLLEQLKEGGLLVAPVGDWPQSMVLIEKNQNGIIEIKKEPNFVFVPLVGRFGKKTFF